MVEVSHGLFGASHFYLPSRANMQDLELLCAAILGIAFYTTMRSIHARLLLEFLFPEGALFSECTSPYVPSPPESPAAVPSPSAATATFVPSRPVSAACVPGSRRATSGGVEVECVVCTSTAACDALVPCGHLNVCRACVASLARHTTRSTQPPCPTCRTPITGTMPIFL